MHKQYKVGSLMYATDSGLGILAKQFYDNKIVTDPIIIEHAHHTTHHEWYPSTAPAIPIRGFSAERVYHYLRGLDAMLFFETPFDWQLIEMCRVLKIKTILMPMYECTPKHLPAKPDLMLCPSLLDHQYYPEEGYLPVPVSIPWKQRTEAKVFVHNAGHGGLKGRNGTAELLDAMMLVKSPIKLILRSQQPLRHDFLGPHPKCGDGPATVDYRVGTVKHEWLFDEGDVFIFPEKFNGLSLPLQEAYASGMLVMASSRFPNNQYLPNDPLIPVAHYVTNSISGRMNDFKEALLSPHDIANHIDEWYGKDITMYSELGKQYAEQNSWQVLRPKYLEVIERLIG